MNNISVLVFVLTIVYSNSLTVRELIVKQSNADEPTKPSSNLTFKEHTAETYTLTEIFNQLLPLKDSNQIQKSVNINVEKNENTTMENVPQKYSAFVTMTEKVEETTSSIQKTTAKVAPSNEEYEDEYNDPQPDDGLDQKAVLRLLG